MANDEPMFRTPRKQGPPPRLAAPPDGLTTILALAAGFTLGRVPELTEWWQGAAALVIVFTFLWRFIRAT